MVRSGAQFSPWVVPTDNFQVVAKFTKIAVDAKRKREVMVSGHSRLAQWGWWWFSNMKAPHRSKLTKNPPEALENILFGKTLTGLFDLTNGKLPIERPSLKHLQRLKLNVELR
jgi:hypothetical protein